MNDDGFQNDGAMERHLQPHKIYTFGRFRLDTAQRLLVFGDTPVPLTPKALDTLGYFLEHRGELLETARLLEAVWPNTVVDENNLRQQVSALRRALRDGDEGERYIVTVPGRGYQFVAPASCSTAESVRSTAAAPTPYQGSPSASIAVLAFANSSGDPGTEFFGDGLADELINSLTRVPGLRVASRTSSFAHRGRGQDARAIARDLRAAMLLEGSIRTSDGRVRATVQLVDGANGFHLWSHTYDRAFEDLFALEDELVAEIVRAINRHLHASFSPVERTPPTRDTEAYHLYLQGRAIQFRANVASLRRSRELFEQALRLDPHFARALSAAAVSHWADAMVFDPAQLAAAEQAARRALELDPTLSEARQVLGNICAVRGNLVDAERCYGEALREDQVDGLVYSDHSLFVLSAGGHLRRALRNARTGYELSPANPAVVGVLALIHSFLANDREAVELIDRALDLGFDVPPHAYVHSCAAFRAGRHAEAADHAVRGLPESVREIGAPAVRITYRALSGAATRDDALVELGHLRNALEPDHAAMQAGVHVMLCYILLGDADAAHDVADRWLAYYGQFGIVSTRWNFYWMPEMRLFRRHARFRTFARRLGLVDYWREFGSPDDRESER